MTAPDPRAHPEIEDATIERMADELVDGKRHPTADRLFMKRGAAAPIIQTAAPISDSGSTARPSPPKCGSTGPAPRSRR